MYINVYKWYQPVAKSDRFFDVLQNYVWAYFELIGEYIPFVIKMSNGRIIVKLDNWKLQNTGTNVKGEWLYEV